MVSSPTLADTNLWVDDVSGNIGLVDVTTGTVSMVNNTGHSLTDIGFLGTQMYGLTFNNLFKIDDTTGAATQIGSAFSDPGMNALVGSNTGLLGASNGTNNIYNIDLTTAALTVRQTVPLPSAGDLAFSGNTLFESSTGTSGADQLVNASADSIVGTFHTTTTSTFNDVFGLANDGVTTFAVAGTEVFSVNLTNALMTPLFDFSGHGLGDANGTAFVAEGGSVTPILAIPEPTTWAMMLLGFGLLGLGAFKRRIHRLA
jgi:hypothetical protein